MFWEIYKYATEVLFLLIINSLTNSLIYLKYKFILKK